MDGIDEILLSVVEPVRTEICPHCHHSYQVRDELAQAKAIILAYRRLASEAQVAMAPVMEQLVRSLPHGF